MGGIPTEKELADQKKELLDSKRPLPKYTLKSLREKLLLEWTYHSNAIEGNTLTIKEMKVVLEGITVRGKTLREHLEVLNHHEAIGYVEEIVHKEGFLPVIIKVANRLEYYDALDKAHTTKDYNDFIQLVATEVVEDSLNLYLSVTR